MLDDFVIKSLVKQLYTAEQMKKDNQKEICNENFLNLEDFYFNKYEDFQKNKEEKTLKRVIIVDI